MADVDFLGRYGPAALVTGASSGIGQSWAEALAARGMDLLLPARRVDRLDALAARLTAAHGVRVTTLAADLADPVVAAAAIVARAADLDIGLVVSNAGFGIRGDFDGYDPVRMGEMLAVNCQAPMLLAHGLIPKLRARGRGGLVFTASVEGLIGCPYSTGYSATKALVIGLGEGLWGELTPAGIDVLTVCPGATDTEALRGAGLDPKTFPNLMSPDEVVKIALENLRNGPVLIPSTHYEAMFGKLLAMPRRDALTAMAGSMKR